MPPACFAAVILVLAAALICHRGRPAAPAQVAVVLVIVLGVFSATLILVILGVIAAAWVMQL